MSGKKSIFENVPKLTSLIVGVSGGVDSISLIEGLYLAKETLNLKLSVAHVNHNLRRKAKSDQKFVEDYCKSRDLNLDIYQAKNPPKSNQESWGRIIRYKFFKELQSSYGADFITTAHTQDDQVELFLMQLFTNKPFVAMKIIDHSQKILRPFINVWKDSLKTEAEESGLKWVEDETNLKNSYLRNRTRNKVIPFLDSTYDGNIKKIISDQIKRFQVKEDIFENAISELYEPIKNTNFGSKSWVSIIKSSIYNAKDPVFLDYFFDRIFFEHLKYRLGQGWGIRILNFFNSQASQIQLPKGKTLKRKQGGMVLINSTT